MRRSSMTAASTLLALLAVSHLSGCVMKSRYNTMLQQQQALESSLRVEINADQVKIEQLENGIRVRVANELLYRSGSVELHPNGRAALDKVAGRRRAGRTRARGKVSHQLGARWGARRDRGETFAEEWCRPDEA